VAQPTPAEVAAGISHTLAFTEVAGPVTVLLAGGRARGGLVSVPLPGNITLALPCGHETVTALPGRDVRQVLIEALEDAIVVAQVNEDEAAERSYQEVLHALEAPLPHLG